MHAAVVPFSGLMAVHVRRQGGAAVAVSRLYNAKGSETLANEISVTGIARTGKGGAQVTCKKVPESMRESTGLSVENRGRWVTAVITASYARGTNTDPAISAAMTSSAAACSAAPPCHANGRPDSFHIRTNAQAERGTCAARPRIGCDARAPRVAARGASAAWSRREAVGSRAMTGGARHLLLLLTYHINRVEEPVARQRSRSNNSPKTIGFQTGRLTADERTNLHRISAIS
jgi:hypothetical protein